MTAQEWIEARQEVRKLARFERYCATDAAVFADPSAFCERKLYRRERARLERAELRSAINALQIAEITATPWGEE